MKHNTSSSRAFDRIAVNILAIGIAWMAVIPQTAVAAPALAIPGRWTAEKANEWYDQQPWLVGCNFIPSTAINQLEMWQADSFDPITIDRELGWAAGLGMNTVRVYLHDLVWQQDSEGFLKRIDQYLAIADKHGIKTMFVLFDACWGSFPELGKQPEPKPRVHNSGWVQSPHIDTLKDLTRHKSLEPYVKGVIGRFKDDARVLAWDLYNEPGAGTGTDRIKHRHKIALCMLLLEDAYEWARATNPSQPLTTGLWNGEWIGPNSTPFNQFVLENADVLSFHDYRALNQTIERVGTLKPFGRPILCTEYLARGEDSRFESHLPYFKKNKIAAYNWGLVAGKTQTQYPWDSGPERFSSEPELWHHDILRPDGSPHRQSEVDLMKSLAFRAQAGGTESLTIADRVPEKCYLFSYFVGNSKDGLHLAWSSDGLKWDALKQDKSFLTPKVGEKLMRDPCIITGPDGTFRMVWTDSGKGGTIGYASSKDLITWSEQKSLPVMAKEPTVSNCWAPEIIFDDIGKRFIIFWASTIPGKFAETDYGGKNDSNHRIYATTTSDFETFTQASLFFDPGFNTIDSTILPFNGKSVMIFKDESRHPKAMKNLRIAIASGAAGPYQVEEQPINPPGSWVEGPSALKVGDEMILYFDAYAEHHYGALKSKDLKTWTDVTKELVMPKGIRHGTAFEVSGTIVKKLMKQ